MPDPNVPDAFAVIADRLGSSLYTSNAQVVVYKLVGNFDPTEAITHGFVDSQQLLAWQTTNASLADFGGFPSSIIEGTYRENDMTLNTSRRHVIATSGRDKYLVSLSVTTDRFAGGRRRPSHRRHHQRLPGGRARGLRPRLRPQWPRQPRRSGFRGSRLARPPVGLPGQAPGVAARSGFPGRPVVPAPWRPAAGQTAAQHARAATCWPWCRGCRRCRTCT